jgi:hypothetical protein
LQILGVTESASSAEIKKAFRALALQHHPDRGGNPETFAQINKAYETVNDETAMENMRTYGNPDGRSALEVSVGLPKFLTTGILSNLLLVAYVLILVVAVPYLMYWFYRRSQNRPMGGLDPATVQWLGITVTDDIPLKMLPWILAGAKEFGDVSPAQADAAELGALAKTIAEDPNVGGFAQPKRSVISPESMHVNWILIHAYLLKLPVKSVYLNEHTRRILRLVEPLAELMAVIAVQRTMYHQSKPKDKNGKSHVDTYFEIMSWSQRVRANDEQRHSLDWLIRLEFLRVVHRSICPPINVLNNHHFCGYPVMISLSCRWCKAFGALSLI